MRVCIFGRGKLGVSLARALRKAGASVVLRSGQKTLTRKPNANVFILTVPDAKIAEVSAHLAPFVSSMDCVFHCAGARGPSELRACRERGASTSTFHPLLSFAGGQTSFAGATFLCDGEKRATRVAKKLARSLDAHVIEAHIAGPAYHAAAATVANGAAALSLLGVRVLMALNVPEKQAQQALSALLASVAQNVRVIGVPQALTGPISRGDAHTIEAHLRALNALSPKLSTDYAALSRLVLGAARAQGLSDDAARAIERALTSGNKRARTPPKSPQRSRTKSTHAGHARLVADR